MKEQKFQTGDLVYFYEGTHKTPGVIKSAEKDENNGWRYVIRAGNVIIANNLPEDKIIARTMNGDHKYNLGDRVRFLVSEIDGYEGYIRMVDSFGTFTQNEEPSYDIYVDGNPGRLYKHIRESDVID